MLLLWINVDSFIPIILPNLNPICHLLALGAHHILHVGRIRVKTHLNLRAPTTLSLPDSLFVLCCSTKILYICSLIPMRATCPSISPSFTRTLQTVVTKQIVKFIIKMFLHSPLLTYSSVQWTLSSQPPQPLFFHVNKKVQLDATVCRHLFTAQSLYMFRVSQHPSSGVLKTLSATSSIGHDAGTSTSFRREGGRK